MKHISYHTRRVIDLVSFLSRFEDVKETRASKDGVRHQYEARCPAHDTSHRSLAIAWTYDEMPLVHCHAGCSPDDVLGAVGLSLGDLCPDGALQERRSPRRKSFQSKVDDNVVVIGKADIEQGKRLSKADKERCRRAMKSINTRGPFDV